MAVTVAFSQRRLVATAEVEGVAYVSERASIVGSFWVWRELATGKRAELELEGRLIEQAEAELARERYERARGGTRA